MDSCCLLKVCCNGPERAKALATKFAELRGDWPVAIASEVDNAYIAYVLGNFDLVPKGLGDEIVTAARFLEANPGHPAPPELSQAIRRAYPKKLLAHKRGGRG